MRHKKILFDYKFILIDYTLTSNLLKNDFLRFDLVS